MSKMRGDQNKNKSDSGYRRKEKVWSATRKDHALGTLLAQLRVEKNLTQNEVLGGPTTKATWSFIEKRYGAPHLTTLIEGGKKLGYQIMLVTDKQTHVLYEDVDKAKKLRGDMKHELCTIFHREVSKEMNDLAEQVAATIRRLPPETAKIAAQAVAGIARATPSKDK